MDGNRKQRVRGFSPKDLRDIAKSIRTQAEEFDHLASEAEKAGIKKLRVDGAGKVEVAVRLFSEFAGQTALSLRRECVSV